MNEPVGSSHALRCNSLPSFITHPSLLPFLLFSFTVLRIEPRSSHMPGQSAWILSSLPSSWFPCSLESTILEKIINYDITNLELSQFPNLASPYFQIRRNSSHLLTLLGLIIVFCNMHYLGYVLLYWYMIQIAWFKTVFNMHYKVFCSTVIFASPCRLLADCCQNFPELLKFSLLLWFYQGSFAEYFLYVSDMLVVNS